MSIDVGIYVPQVSVSFEAILEQAVRVERLGFNSFWLYDHLYTPGLPDKSSLEGWTLATALLARTTTLRVGHLVLDNNLRHPVLLAKMIATADVISHGRLDVGLGSGSYPLEHEQAGIAFGSMATRSAQLGEALAILDAMLTQDTVDFHGEHYHVHGMPSRPQPVQQPRPPFHVGGISERHTLPLVARYADVWNVPTYALAGWEHKAKALVAACERVERDPATIRWSHEAVLVLAADDTALADARERAARRYPGPGFGVDAGGYVGTPAALVDHMGAMREAGISQFTFIPCDRGQGDVLDLLAEVVLPQLQ
jgi:alkanesulfonate monooxygenase SsuD/methylene tetrahydromethanopterin reductase-like flavin-dependent oxidoreductase (luciferase family)